MSKRPQTHYYGQNPYDVVRIEELTSGDQIPYLGDEGNCFGTVAVATEGKTKVYWVVHPSLPEGRRQLTGTHYEKFLKPPLKNGASEPKYKVGKPGDLDNLEVVHFKGRKVTCEREWPQGANKPINHFKDGEGKEVIVPADALLVRVAKPTEEAKKPSGGLLGVLHIFDGR